MIVVLDSNALHGDVYAERTHAQTVISAAAGRFVVRVPSVVIEEMVRQFPERIRNATAALKEARHDVTAFGFELPTLPDEQEAIAEYRDKLLANLHEDGVSIAPPPRSAGVIAEWVAERRKPIPGDGRGTVDAQIWLTAVEAAEDADGETTYLISNNSDDFADPDDRTKLHPKLLEELREKGLGEDAVVLLPRMIDFIKREIEPNQEAEGKARALFANPERRKELVSELRTRSAGSRSEPPRTSGTRRCRRISRIPT